MKKFLTLTLQVVYTTTLALVAVWALRKVPVVGPYVDKALVG